MKKRGSDKNSALTFNKEGTVEVSKQIMDSYNSGYINKHGMHGELEPSSENKLSGKK